MPTLGTIGAPCKKAAISSINIHLRFKPSNVQTSSRAALQTTILRFLVIEEWGGGGGQRWMARVAACLRITVSHNRDQKPPIIYIKAVDTDKRSSIPKVAKYMFSIRIRIFIR